MLIVSAMKNWAMDQMKSRVVNGKRITISLTEFEGLNPDDGGKWVLMCETHSFIIQDTNKRRLWAWSTEPQSWCEDCQAEEFSA